MYFKMIVPFLAVILAVASAGLTGAPMDADMNDEGVKSALQFAVAQYNRQSNDAFVRQVSEVIKVQRQVSIYTFTFCLSSFKLGTSLNHASSHEVLPRMWSRDGAVMRITGSKTNSN